MTLRQWLLVAALGLPLLSSIALGVTGGGWVYCGLMTAMLVLFGIAEYISVRHRGRTISKDIGKSKPWVFWFVTGSFVALGVFMAWHWILYL